MFSFYLLPVLVIRPNMDIPTVGIAELLCSIQAA
jgi:hypothetical protein